MRLPTCIRCPHPERQHSPIGCLVVGCGCSRPAPAPTVTLGGIAAAALAVLALCALGSCGGDGVAVHLTWAGLWEAAKYALAFVAGAVTAVAVGVFLIARAWNGVPL